MLKQTGMILGLALGLLAGAGAQGVNPPVAPNLPPPGNDNSTTYGGPLELFVGGSMQFAKATTANSVSLNTSNVAGGQAALRYHVNDWNAVEFRFAMAEPTQLYGTSTTVKSLARELSFDYALTFPTDGFVRPFFLGGLGTIHYKPTGGTNTPGAVAQNKITLIYGGGLDFKISTHFSLRAEYRGLFYRVPDFGLIGISKWNHMVEPDAGLVWHF